MREQVRTLVDRGARAFVVSLLWSFVNPAHEKAVKRIIREEYRDYHVGYLPVILSSEVVSRLGEYGRSNTAILDAYLQRSMQIELSGTWDKLRERGYRGPFFMIHNTGGCADLFKTTASRTYNGGPIAGLIGARDIAKLLGAHNVVTADVGGTSFDIGLVVRRLRPQLRVQPDHRPVDGLDDDAAVAVDRRRRRLDRVAQRGARRAAGGRARGPPAPTPARSPTSSAAPSRRSPTPTSCSATCRRTRSSPAACSSTSEAAEEAIKTHDRRPARRLDGRGGGADPAHHRRQDGVGDPQGGDAARLPADGLHAVRVRRRRADARRRLHGRDPARGDVPVLAGVLRVRLVDHGRRPPLRALAPDDAAGAAHGPARARPRRVQRARARADGRGAARARGRGPELGRRRRCRSSSTASTAARSTPSARRRRCCSWSQKTTCATVYERFEQEFSEAFSPLAVNVAGGVYIDTFVLRVAIPGQQLELPELETADGRGDAVRARGRRTSTAGSTRRCTSSRRCSPATASPARRSSRPRTRPR